MFILAYTSFLYCPKIGVLYPKKNIFPSKVARCPEDGCRFLEEFGFLVANNNLTSTEVKKYYNAMKLSDSEVTMIK